MEEFITNLPEKLMNLVITYGPVVLKAVAVLIIGYLITNFVTGSVKKLLRKTKVDETLTKFVGSLIKVFLLTFVFISTLNVLGVETTSLVAILGAAGLAVGLALQGSLSNFSSGVMLIVFRPFQAGDYVEAGGTGGSVEEIKIFNTILKTPDNKMVIIPNSNIIGNNIINYSAKENRRIDMEFGIGYGDDLKKAKDILRRIVKEDARILEDPAPTVAVKELGDSSVNFAVRPWVKTADYWDVYFDFTEKVKITFDNEGISIPFPQRDVHLFQEKTVSSKE